MAKGDPVTSPWMWQATDYQGAVIRITITFDNTTRALSGCTVFRDANCVYTKIYIGLGADGTPDTTVKKLAVAAGTTVYTATQMSNRGLDVIEDVLNLQITSGP